MSILQLPPELLLRVAAYLTTPELGYLKRTCTQIEDTLFPSFAREFFTKRQFMIEHISLQALVDIANNPKLSPWVSEVIIDLNRFNIEATRDVLRKTRIFQLMHKYGHYSSDLLLCTGKAFEMLVEAFSELKNLHVVDLRDFSAKGRARDGDVPWKSWGWSYHRAIPLSEWNREHGQIIPAHGHPLFPMLLHALARANAKPATIQVFLRSRSWNGVGVAPSVFGLSNSAVEPSIEIVLRGLTTLMLTIAEAEYRVDHAEDTGSSKSARIEAYESPLRLLLQSTHNLEHLRLNFDQRQWYGCAFLGWLGQPASVTGISFTNLTNLDLGLLTIDESALLQIINKPKSLTNLNLWKVSLICDEAREPGATETTWSTFCSNLVHAVPLTLTFIRIGYISELVGPRLRDIEFGSASSDTDIAGVSYLPSPVVEYRGPDLKSWLEKLATASVIRAVDYYDDLLDSQSETLDDDDGDDIGLDDIGLDEDEIWLDGEEEEEEDLSLPGTSIASPDALL